jgi:NDP-sugar pyrophosphorylase family protein
MTVRLVGLVGGKGSRPYPSTANKSLNARELAKVNLGEHSYNANAVPKPLISLGGTALMLPLFSSTISQCGIQDIAMAVMYMPEDIIHFFGPNMERLRQGTGSSLYWNHQQEYNLNTAGCVVRGWQQDLKAREGRSDIYIILSADIRCNADVSKILELHQRQNALISLGLAPVPRNQVRRFGVVYREGAIFGKDGWQLSGSGGPYTKIARFQEKSPEARSDLNNASIYIISARLMQLIEDDVRVAENKNQLDPKTLQKYIKMTPSERREINPYNLPIPGIDGIPAKDFDPLRGNYVNDYTDPSGNHWRLGTFSSILKKLNLINPDPNHAEANKNFQDWGGHIFPNVAQHHPEIYKGQNPEDASGFYGYVLQDKLWADDGTRTALLSANHQLLMQVGGFELRHDFSWWPIPYQYDSDKKVWVGENVRIEEGAQIIGPAIIGNNVVVKKNSVVRFSVIGDGWTINNSRLDGSVLWPDRRFMGLPVSDPALQYQLLNMQLENCMVGGGIHKAAKEIYFDNNGRYNVAVPLPRQGSAPYGLSGQVLVSNMHGVMVAPLDEKLTDVPRKTSIPDIRTPAVVSPKQRLEEIKANSWILVVDDNGDFRATVLKALNQKGWKLIDTAESQEEAEKMLASKKYAFISLDSVLTTPEEVEKKGEAEGITIAKNLKQNQLALNYETPILLWSSIESQIALKGLSAKEGNLLADLGVKLYIDKSNANINLLEEMMEKSLLSK